MGIAGLILRGQTVGVRPLLPRSTVTHTARAYHTQILQHKWTKNFYILSIDGKAVPHKITIYHH